MGRCQYLEEAAYSGRSTGVVLADLLNDYTKTKTEEARKETSLKIIRGTSSAPLALGLLSCGGATEAQPHKMRGQA